jgi:predicted HAD superfamily Cof-like phosphohydrolase
VAGKRVASPSPDQDSLFSPLASITSLSAQSRRARATPASDCPPPGVMVRRFHESFGLPVSPSPTLDVPAELLELRRALLQEELEELTDALSQGDIVSVADALGDVVYVVYGTAVTLGVDLDAVVAEVHRANMSKLGPNGEPMCRADGKVLKGPDYQPPDIAAALGFYGPSIDACR